MSIADFAPFLAAHFGFLALVVARNVVSRMVA